jgi:ubiquitin carboxyl-terminal hydrolase 7
LKLGLHFLEGILLVCDHESCKNSSSLITNMNEGGSPPHPSRISVVPKIDNWFEQLTDLGAPLIQPYDGDLESPNDMMVDPEDFVTEQPEDEKVDVAIINPDQLGNDVDIDMAEKLRADNCALIPSALLSAFAMR